MKTLVAIGVILASGAVIPACGGLTGDVCDEVCSCEDCSDIDRDECEIKIDASQDVSSAYGCDDAYEAQRNCEIKSYICVGGKFTVMMDNGDGTLFDPCAAERAELIQCTKDGSATQ